MLIYSKFVVVFNGVPINEKLIGQDVT